MSTKPPRKEQREAPRPALQGKRPTQMPAKCSEKIKSLFREEKELLNNFQGVQQKKIVAPGSAGKEAKPQLASHSNPALEQDQPITGQRLQSSSQESKMRSLAATVSPFIAGNQLQTTPRKRQPSNGSRFGTPSSAKKFLTARNEDKVLQSSSRKLTFQRAWDDFENLACPENIPLYTDDQTLGLRSDTYEKRWKALPFGGKNWPGQQVQINDHQKPNLAFMMVQETPLKSKVNPELFQEQANWNSQGLSHSISPHMTPARNNFYENCFHYERKSDDESASQTGEFNHSQGEMKSGPLRFQINLTERFRQEQEASSNSGRPREGLLAGAPKSSLRLDQSVLQFRAEMNNAKKQDQLANIRGKASLLRQAEQDRFEEEAPRLQRNIFESEAKQAKWKLKKQEKELAASQLRRNVFQTISEQEDCYTYTMKAFNSLTDFNQQLQRLKQEEIQLLDQNAFDVPSQAEEAARKSVAQAPQHSQKTNEIRIEIPRNLPQAQQKQTLKTQKAKSQPKKKEEPKTQLIPARSSDLEENKREKRKVLQQKENVENEQRVTGPKAKKTQFCKCTNSRCIKKYCICLKFFEYCSPQTCGCTDCMNNTEHEKERQEAIELFKAAPKKQGCNCKKNDCSKKYCYCLANGLACTEDCKCAEVECQNKRE